MTTSNAIPSGGSEPVVQIQDLRVVYHARRGIRRKKVDIVAVDGVSIELYRGHTLGLVGATGSGKSTIAQVIMGMVAPTSGSVRIQGHEIGAGSDHDRKGFQRAVQVVLQDPYSSLDPRMKVGDIIAEPLTLGRPLRGGKAKREVTERVKELMGLVRLPPSRAGLYPHQFSGGQRQRIAVARALAPRPEIVVLDEPTSALDVSVRAQILTLLRGIQRDLGVTYLIISHDLVTVAYLASTVAVMHLGRIVEIGPTRKLYSTPRHPYTLELISSAPGASGAFLNRPRPADRSPSSLPPTACGFAYRCALRTYLGDPDRCLEVDPPLQSDDGQHFAACHFPSELEAFAADLESRVPGEASAPTPATSMTTPTASGSAEPAP